MRIGIMQPYFFPYLGYFNLLLAVDLLVVYDTVPFSTGGWLNRNRLLHPTRGWKYLTVPLMKSSYRNHLAEAVPIRQVRISARRGWELRLLGQLEHYASAAPFYRDAVALVRECLDAGFERIAALNVAALANTCSRLGIRFDHRLASELGAGREPGTSAQEQVLRICERLGAKEYVNLPGGRALYSESAFARRGIALTFCEIPPLEYDCGPYGFVPDLSIIDLLMWNSPQRIAAHLQASAPTRNSLQ